MSVQSVNEKLAAITAAGTSVWLDQIRRGMIEDGELQRMLDEDSLRGVTSNPAIFEKAILGSSDYDEELSELAAEGLDAKAIYERMAIHDVQLACDVMRPIYDESNGYDGYVSLEVAPNLAHETEGTLEQARDFWARVDRPNLMIKIPATEAGIPAIEEALYEGMNVNVTLLFAVSWHRKVMEAFIRAMERRHEEGKPLDRHSVASFFVSRVDSEVDARLEDLGRSELSGKAGLANARAAYQAFKEVFHGARFAELKAAGCPVQRPLWASTGVKNPQYPDTLYVDGLIGPDTVNTMPLPTLLAACERATIDGATADLEPWGDLEAIKEAGIDLDDVTEKLLNDGIAAFVTPMDKLIDGVERQREAITTGRPPAIDTDLPSEIEQAVIARVRKAAEEDVARRIWHRDGTLWGPEGTPEITNRLGWLTIADKVLDDCGRIQAFVRRCQSDGLTTAVLLGMGGSSLAPEVYRQSYGDEGEALRLLVLDTTDPLEVAKVEAAIDLDKTLFIVSSKSGGTIEPNALFEHFHAKQPDGSHYIAITDPGSSLAALAEEHDFRRIWINDPDIGGRYSALSYFGMVPAALMGVDIEGQLHAAEVAEQACQSYTHSRDNSGLWLGIALGELALAGRDKLTFIVDEPVGSFGLWVEQLIAESLGKEGKGILPVALEPLAEPGSYGSDRVFVHLRHDDAPDETNEKQAKALAGAGHPVLTVQHHGPGDLGRIFFFSEFATAVAGWVLGINPFDQPNVQEAKDNTARVLDEGSPELEDGSLGELLDGAAPPNFVAIMGYLPYDDAVDEAVSRLRAAIVEKHGVATTWGYGPRFLHSTGQLHKGGPPTGLFLQFVHDSDQDLEIPGRPFSFRTLLNAQADGDLQTLRAHGLKAVRVRLNASDLAGSIDSLVKEV